MSEKELVFIWLALISVITVCARLFANKYYEKAPYEGGVYYSYSGESKLIPFIYWILNGSALLLSAGFIGYVTYMLN